MLRLENQYSIINRKYSVLQTKKSHSLYYISKLKKKVFSDISYMKKFAGHIKDVSSLRLGRKGQSIAITNHKKLSMAKNILTVLRKTDIQYQVKVRVGVLSGAEQSFA